MLPRLSEEVPREAGAEARLEVSRTRGTGKSPAWSILNLTKLSSRSCTVMWEDRQETLMPGEAEDVEGEEEEEVVVDSLYLS